MTHDIADTVSTHPASEDAPKRPRKKPHNRPFDEYIERASTNRSLEQQMFVMPAVLAGAGATPGVCIYYASKPMVLTQAAALALATGIVDVLGLGRNA